MQIQQEAAFLREQLDKRADAKKAAGAKVYLKSALDFYGVAVPEVRQIARAWLKKHKATGIDEVVKVAAALWDSTWHEEKLLAIHLMQVRSRQLTQAHLGQIERMMDEATTWAHLDEIALRLIGALIDSDPTTLEHLPRWAASDNFWVRRAAILAQIPQFRRGEGDFELFERLAVPMFDEGPDWTADERFFIRKAIGWALRELARVRPERVAAFAQAHRDEMAGLTFREATRLLPDDLQRQVGG